MTSSSPSMPPLELPVGCGKPFSQAHRAEFGPVVLIEFAGAELCEGAVILEGLPGNGIISTITTGFLLEQLSLPLVGVLVSNEFPPIGIVSAGQPLPPVRIYGDSRIVVVVAEFKISERGNSLVLSGICEAIMEFARRHRCKRVISVDGVPVLLEEIEPAKIFEDTKTSDSIQFVSTDSKLWDALSGMGCKPLNSAVLTGMTGVMVAKSAIRVTDVDPSVTCILSNSNSSIPDAWGAVHVIQVLCKLMAELEHPIQVDVGPLEKKAAELESKIKRLIGDATSSVTKRRTESMSMYS